MNADVTVVGAGLAGLAAAWSAAACGARVLCCEKDSSVGGNVGAAKVHSLCGLYLGADAEGGDAVHAHPGLPRHFAEQLQRAGAAGAPLRSGRVWVLPTSPARVIEVASARCRATPGLELWPGAELVAAELGADGGELVFAGAGHERRCVRTAVAVDASGDACAAALVGAALEAAPEELRQRSSFIVRLGGVDPQLFEGLGPLQLSYAIASAARHGELPLGCESALLRRGAASDELYLTLNLPREGDPPEHPLDPQSLADCSERARALVSMLLDFLAKTRPAFARARVLEWPQRVGVRETRRIDGRLTLTRDDILCGRRRDDEIAISTWPIELWEDHRRARFEHPRAAAGIPLGALLARAQPRLAAAGRCISASHEALGALRVLGTALATGEAAGIAAALAADRGSSLDAIAPAEIRATIARSSASA